MNNILIIANMRKTHGGITTQVIELYDSLISEGIKVDIVSTYGSIIERMKSVYTAFKKAKECDVILGVGCAYTGFFPIIVANLVSMVTNKYIIYNFHDGQVSEFLKRYYGIINIVFRRNEVVVATRYLDDEFKKYGINSIIIQNHFNDLQSVDMEKPYPEKIKIMWARSFERLYRADLALDVAEYFINNKNLEFHYYGGGSEYDYYSNKYTGDNIFFHGILKRNELLNEYGKYNIFLNTTEYDNFPMSIVEAGLNNMIVVSSKVGGIKTLYTDKEIVFFESGNIDNLYMVLSNVINNFSDYTTYPKNLLNKVKSFNWMNVKQQWMNSLNISNL